tara:strand:+ start:2801 stop:3139 length:339 start_codon:yes stop_codon:yes gene_type:complete
MSANLDIDIQKWIEDFGSVTSYTYIVYSSINEDDLNTIYAGVKFLSSNLDVPFMFLEDTIDEKMARQFGVKRGHKLQITFPGNEKSREIELRKIVEEGLDYLRLEYKYWGCF